MRTLEERLIVAIGFIVVLIGIAGTLAFRAIRDNIDTNLEATRSRATLSEIQSTLLTLKEAEKVRNNRLAEEGPDAIDRLEQARDAAVRKLFRLKAIASGDTERHERIVAAENATHKRIDTLKKEISERSDVNAAASQQELAAAEISETDELGRLLNDMRVEEGAALDTRLARAESNMYMILVSFSVCGVLVLLLLVLVFFLVRHDSRVQRTLNEELERLATTDPLTGIFNRRELTRLISVEAARSERYAQPLSLLTVDVDHFKAVNDSHGHQMGDEVLKRVAERIVRTARMTDAVGRIGGEEFAIVLPNTSQTEACVLAERIREDIAATPCETPDGAIPVTVSIGVAEKFDRTSVQQMVRASDEALYSAKAHGRNRVAVGPVPLSQQPLPGGLNIGEQLVVSAAV